MSRRHYTRLFLLPTRVNVGLSQALGIAPRPVLVFTHDALRGMSQHAVVPHAAWTVLMEGNKDGERDKH